MVKTIEMRRVLLDYFITTRGKDRVRRMSDSQVFAIYTKLRLAGKV